jgi:hypothetical protein
MEKKLYTSITCIVKEIDINDILITSDPSTDIEAPWDELDEL